MLCYEYSACYTNITPTKTEYKIEKKKSLQKITGGILDGMFGGYFVCLFLKKKGFLKRIGAKKVLYNGLTLLRGIFLLSSGRLPSQYTFLLSCVVSDRYV